jgi:hypothetical protein
MKTFVKQNVNEDQNGRGDCVARAITKASGIPYYTVYEDLKDWCKRNPGNGHPSYGVVMNLAWMKAYGFQWYPMRGCNIEDVPNVGRYVVLQHRHAVAVVEGQIFDTGDPRKRTTRIEGFWLWVGTALSK